MPLTGTGAVWGALVVGSLPTPPQTAQMTPAQLLATWVAICTSHSAHLVFVTDLKGVTLPHVPGGPASLVNPGVTGLL